MPIRFPKTLKDLVPNFLWDAIKWVGGKIGDSLLPIIIMLSISVSAYVINLWQSNPTLQIVLITIVGTSFIWSICISIFYLIRKLINARNESEDGKQSPVKQNSKNNEECLSKNSPSNCVIPGFLDTESILPIDSRKIIPTKYLFAHTKSYDFYESLREHPGYTIKVAESLFGIHSHNLAECIENLVKDKRKLTIVSLGIGFAVKENILLGKLCHKKIEICMSAIDINPSFINYSLKYLHKNVKSSEIDYKFLIGDFDNINNYDLPLPKDRPILFLALGGVFGNQNEAALLDKLRKVSQGEKYLLIDFQTKESLQTIDKGGYDSDANKEFIKNIITAFCKDTLEPKQIQASYYRNLPRLMKDENPKPSDVPKSETIVMVGEKVGSDAETLKRYYVGYSTRYEKDALKKYLVRKKCKIIEEFDSQAVSHTSLLLCRLS